MANALEDEVIAAWHGRVRRDLAVGRPERDAAAIAERDAYFALLDVYADQLIAANDPRGEVIALGRRDQDARGAIVAWLGADLADREHVRVWLGGVTLEVHERDGDGDLVRLLASPGAGYLSDLELTGRGPFLAHVCKLLAARPHPWLRRLAVSTPYGSPPPRDLFDALIPTIPNLATLAVTGLGIGDFPHPTLSHVTAHDARLLAPLVGRGRPLPAVVAVDVAFRSGFQVWDWSEMQRALPPSHLPALRALALEVQAPGLPVYEFVELCAARHPALTRLDLPPLRTTEDCDRFERILAALPALDYVRVAWNHGDGRDFYHPRADLDIAILSPSPLRR